ncbi:MAG: GNAT family N-acetyltransferase, partial [Clostridia bacterium]|nr:GNAT family N-acetyltransferase [Clostridia bacterium]
MKLPENMAVIHQKDFDAEKYRNYSDETYFRLIHYLNNAEIPKLPDGFSVCSAQIGEFVGHINKCYHDIRVSEAQMKKYTESEVYDGELWLAVKEKNTGEIVATGIAEVDRDAGEGAVEWVQVSREYRRKGLGEYIVKHLLYLMKGKADFATVSGKCDSLYQPEKLYRKCG